LLPSTDKIYPLTPGPSPNPPCAEGLTFLVTTQRLPLDVAFFNALKAVVGFNSHFTQNSAGSPNVLSLSPEIVATFGAAVARAPAEGIFGTQAGNAREASNIVKELVGFRLTGII
jgi:hypothetical protein